MCWDPHLLASALNFYCLRILTCVLFFAVRYSSNPLAKRHHFGHVGGPDSDIVSSLRRTISAFTGKNRERQTKLSQASSLTLRELITNGRFESNACTLLRKLNFLFRDSVDKDAEMMYDGNYKWLHQLGERRFFLPIMERMFSLSFIQSTSLHRLMKWELKKEQSGVSLGWISHHTTIPAGYGRNVVGLLSGSLCWPKGPSP